MLNRIKAVKEWNGLKIGDICRVKQDGSVVEVKGLWDNGLIRAIDSEGDREFFFNLELISRKVEASS